MSIRICHYNHLHHPDNQPFKASWILQPGGFPVFEQRETCSNHLAHGVKQLLDKGAAYVEVTRIS